MPTPREQLVAVGVGVVIAFALGSFWYQALGLALGLLIGVVGGGLAYLALTRGGGRDQ